MEDYDHSAFQKPGSFCWVEIPVLDLDRASAFYSKLFGWEFTRPSVMGLPDEGTYLIFSKKGTSAHGGLQVVKDSELIQAKDASEWTVRVTVCVESVDDALAEAEVEGGKIILTKTPIGQDMGNKGVLKDTEGNTIGVFEPGTAGKES